MVDVSNADRIVFPELGTTKGDVVAYYERIAGLALPHLAGRPLSIKRFPKGLVATGFFQKNVPAYYPESFTRVQVPRRAGASKSAPKPPAEVTTYPLVDSADQLAYLANQGALELHVPTSKVPTLSQPDRIVVDLDPPIGTVELVRRAALVVRDALASLGLDSAPVATGSKGYHVVAPIHVGPTSKELGLAMHRFATMLAANNPETLTVSFRVALRGPRVFVDFLRNFSMATVIAPYSLRARPRATVAAPFAWGELFEVAPDTFSIVDAERLLERRDTLTALPRGDGNAFVAAVGSAFEASGLTLERFDRFRS